MLYKVFHKDYVKIKDDHIEIGIIVKPVKGETNLEIIKKLQST
jgi:uncharacterized protein YggU (UPF0235/DUF167 family)